MTVTPPENVNYGRVEWQAISDITDGPDSGSRPDFIAPSGTVTFTASTVALRDTSALPNAVSILRDPIIGVLNDQGYLCTPDDLGAPSYRGVELVATDDPDLNPTDWVYNVTYKITGKNGRQIPLQSHQIYVPTDTTVDLTKVGPVENATAIGIPQAEALAAEAQAAALDAQARAAAAEASADAAETFAQQAGTASDAAVADRLTNGTQSKAALAAQIGAISDSKFLSAVTVPDMGNSWWQTTDCVYDPATKRVWIGGINRAGQVHVGSVDLAGGAVFKKRLTHDRWLADDHHGVGLGFDFSTNRRPVFAYSRHDSDTYLRVRESDAYQGADGVGPEQRLQFNGGQSVAYGSVLAKPTEASKRVATTNGSAVLTSLTIAGSPTAHLLADGMRYRWSVAPTGFVAGTTYFVVSSTADPNQFGLAASPGGAAITAGETSGDATKTLTDAGRGCVYCRVNGEAIWVARSQDMQVSVTSRPTTTPATFEDSSAERFRLINKTYLGLTRAGESFWCFATSDATPSGDLYASVKTYFFKGIPVRDGTLRNAAGNVVGRLWGPAPAAGQPMVALGGANGADLIYDAVGNDGVRWYDMARGGDAIACLRFDRRDFDVDDNGQPNQAGRNPENGGTYAVLRRQTSASTNTWQWENVIASGKPFGAYKSVYVGGAVFERDDANANALLAVVEADGVWSVKRFTRSGDAYTVGTWTLDKTIYTAPAGRKLGRPRVPYGAEGMASGQRLCVVSEYPRYEITSFLDWTANQKVVTY